MNVVQVRGLLLSGGQSRRMGTDKGLLCYRGQTTEIERWKAVFDRLAVPFHWSQRPQQYPSDLFPHITRLFDQKPGSGPLGALLSAHREHPENAWLVLACDWPLLGEQDIAHLLQQRAPGKDATSYVHEGRRQPLCSLYEPAFLRRAQAAWDAGEESLHRLLEAADVWDVQALDDERFLNVNDLTLREEVAEHLRTAPSPHLPHQSAR